MSTLEFVKSKGGTNIQEFVNTTDADAFGKGGSINVGRLNEILTFMFQNGWSEIHPTVNDIRGTVNPGTQMRYLSKGPDGKIKFRSGGFFVGIFEPDGTLTTINKDTGEEQLVEEPFIVYTSHNSLRVSLQLRNVYRFYMKERIAKKPKEKKSKLVQFKIPEVMTNFPVCMTKDGQVTTVYYARDEYSRKRFMSSMKFQRAMKIGWEFSEE